MSTHSSEVSSSFDCPEDINGGKRVQRVAGRGAQVGGGITVSRILPSSQRRMVGAWCFLDHAGPAVFTSGSGLRVGPHPHIGLQTFTWMIQGEVLHRDSLGHVQVVKPGQVNLMTAGRGISHTEESLPGEDKLHAVQLWIALPSKDAACEPAFDHHPDLPRWREGECDFTLLAGTYAQHQAPSKMYSPMVGMDLSSSKAGEVRLNLNPEFEYGFLVVQGTLGIQSEQFEANELAYVGRGLTRLSLSLSAGSRVIVLGGEPYTEELVLWWNFVGENKEVIGQAQRDWRAAHERFGVVHGYDGEPLIAPDLPWESN